jgi:hypothetical protein
MEQPVLTSDDRNKMTQARDFIQQRKYKDARILLENINHPKAIEWLAKIDEVELGDPFERKQSLQVAPSALSRTTVALLQNTVALMVENGWDLKIQTNNITQLEKQRRPNKLASTIWILLLSLLGSLIVCLVIAGSKKEIVTLEIVDNKLYFRHGYGTYHVKNMDDAKNIAESVPSGIGYSSAILTGIVVTLIIWACLAATSLSSYRY